MVVERRVDDLEHRYATAFPAPHARRAGEGVLAPTEKVSHVVAAAHLLVHEVLDVGDQPASPQGTKTRPNVEEAHERQSTPPHPGTARRAREQPASAGRSAVRLARGRRCGRGTARTLRGTHVMGGGTRDKPGERRA